MYIFFLSKKKILWYLFLIFLLILGFFFCSNFTERSVPTVNPIYIGNTGEKALALMFNVDWGEEIIPEILEELKNKEVKATFFISGRIAQKSPELLLKIAEAGHEIGNHGYSHPHADQLNLEQNVKEIQDTEKVFQDLQISAAKIFAPPYGEHSPVVLQAADSLGYKTIMWTLDTIDWQDPPPEVIINRIVPKADNGSLVLMHPKKCTLQALPTLINSLKEKGFVFKKVTEMIR